MLEGGRAAGSGAPVSRSPGGDVDTCLHFFLNFFFFFENVRACVRRDWRREIYVDT